MSSENFNAFYQPYLRALSIKNIYLNQFKHSSLWIAASYIIMFFIMISSICFVRFSPSKYYLPAIILLIVSTCLFLLIDKITLHNCVKILRHRYKIKFLIPTYFEQFKYYLWKEKLQDTPLSFSINKSLQFLEMELGKFKADNLIPKDYIIILSGITFVAFWRIFDDAHLSGSYKMLIDMAIFYASYRYLTFRLYFFPSKQKKLLEFKQYLLRLKSEYQ